MDFMCRVLRKARRRAAAALGYPKKKKDSDERASRKKCSPTLMRPSSAFRPQVNGHEIMDEPMEEGESFSHCVSSRGGGDRRFAVFLRGVLTPKPFCVG